GALLLADRMGYVDFGQVVSTWWPTLIVLAGLTHLRHQATRWFGVILVVGGGLWQFNRLGLLPTGLAQAFWPLLLILLGLLLVFRGGWQDGYLHEGDASFGSMALFSSRNHVVKTDNLRKAQVTAVFADTDVDLREAKLDSDGAYVDLVAIFGDIDVIVPPTWQVDLKTASILGDVRDRRAPAGEGPAPMLTIGGVAVFGDIEIRS